MLQTGRHTSETLRELRELGVGIALDDFGTGYSSLVSLEQLPLTRVKLDRSLIATIDTSTRSQAITRAIISLCQSLGLEITAEGVERPEQLGWLLGYPAMHIQGYLLSPAVAEADLLTAMTGMPVAWTLCCQFHVAGQCRANCEAPPLTAATDPLNPRAGRCPSGVVQDRDDDAVSHPKACAGRNVRQLHRERTIARARALLRIGT